MSHKPPSTIQELLRKYGFMRQEVKRVKADLDMLQTPLDTPVGRISQQLIEGAAAMIRFEDLAERVDGKCARNIGNSHKCVTERLWWLLEVVYYG